MLIGTVGAGLTVTLNSQFIPQYIVLRNQDGSQVDVTAMQINVQGDGVIFNLNAAGMLAMRSISQFNVAVSVGQVYQLSNGLVNGKNTFWTITNNAAAALDVFGWSKEKGGNMYLTYLTQLCLANSGTDFTDFGFLAIPASVQADSWTVIYNDGTVNVGSIREQNGDIFYRQFLVQNAIHNINPARVKMLTIIPGANRDAFVLRYQKVSGNVDSALVAKG